MDRHKAIETVYDNKLITDWLDNINIDAQYVKGSRKILDTFAEFQKLLDELLGRIHGQTAHWTDLTGRTPYQLRFVPLWTQSTRIRKGENRRNALHESYRATTVRMGTFESIFFQEEWLARTLYQL